MNPDIADILARAKVKEDEGMDRRDAILEAAREHAGPDMGKGNIDLNNRPVIRNPDGSISTVYSGTFGPEEDGSHVLVPGVRPGLDRQMTVDESYDWYQKTGQHLGKFKTQAEADAYARSLHKKQAKLYR